MTREELTYSKVFCLPRFSSTSARMPPTYSSLVRIVARITGSSTLAISLGSSQREGLSISIIVAVGLGDLVAHAGRGGDQVEIELALEPLLNDLHVEQAEKAATEAEAERDGAFRLEEERRIVEPQFFERLAQLRVLVGVDRVEPGEDHGLDFFEAGQRLDRGIGVVGDGVADLGVGDVLDVGDEETDFAGLQLVDLHRLGREHAESFRVESGAVPQETDSLALAQRALKHAGEHDDAAVGVEPGVENQRLEPVVGRFPSAEERA